MGVINVWTGATTATSVVIAAKVTGTVAQLLVDVGPSLSGAATYGPVVPDIDGIFKIQVTGLEPRTRYYFGIDDGQLDTVKRGTFQTFPVLGEPASYHFAAASCAGHVEGGYTQNAVSNHPVFDSIRIQDPLFFAHLGDLHYRDIATNDPALFEAAYDDVLATDRQGLLYRSTNLVYLWDDHDCGGNNCDCTSTSLPAAQATYRRRVPHYPLPHADAIYHSFGVGRILYLAADVRSHRSPNTDPDGPSKVMLGSAQKSMMETVLTSPGFDARFLVWLMPSQWMGTSTDSWESFRTEQAELVQMFGDLGWINRMCIVSGDMHGLAMDTGGSNPWGGFPVHQFAALDGEPHGSVLTYYDMGPSQPGRNQYGTVDIHDCGAGFTAKATGWVGDEEWKSHTQIVDLEEEPDMLPATVTHYQSSNEDGFTNTSWNKGSNTCGVTFVAGTSGKVRVDWSARMETNTGDGVLVSVEVRTGSSIGSGSVVASASDDFAIETAGVAAGNNQQSQFRLVAGLTPGNTYNACLVHRVTAGNADIFARRIMVTGQL